MIRNDTTAVLVAAENGRMDVADFLLDKGARIETQQ